MLRRPPPPSTWRGVSVATLDLAMVCTMPPPCKILWARHGLLLLRQCSGNECLVTSPQKTSEILICCLGWVLQYDKYYLHGHPWANVWKNNTLSLSLMTYVELRTRICKKEIKLNWPWGWTWPLISSPFYHWFDTHRLLKYFGRAPLSGSEF